MFYDRDFRADSYQTIPRERYNMEVCVGIGIADYLLL